MWTMCFAQDRKALDMVTKTNKYTQVYEDINAVITPTYFGHACGHPQGGALQRIDTLRHYKSL
jgi:hypothetical protein